MPVRISLSTTETPPSGFCLSNPIYVKIHNKILCVILTFVYIIQNNFFILTTPKMQSYLYRHEP